MKQQNEDAENLEIAMGKPIQSFTTTGFNVFGEVIGFLWQDTGETEVDSKYQQIFNTYGVDKFFQVGKICYFSRVCLH